MAQINLIVSIFYKIFVSKPEYNQRHEFPAYKNQVRIVRRIWNNETHIDVGLEKLLRLFLACIQFIFPAILLRQILWKKGSMYQAAGIEFYVLFKTLLPIVFLWTNCYQNWICIWVMYYLLIESFCYISALIFISDELVKPRSYRRSVLLLVVGYFQITLGFAVIYAGLHLLNSNAKTPFDYVYFSFVTSATIGFGDIFPVANFGKVLVCLQSLFFFVFVGVFISYFNSKVNPKDYFDVQKEREQLLRRRKK